MRTQQFWLKMLFGIFCIGMINSNLLAQTTKELNQILPMNLADSRAKINKSIGGMEFLVRADILFPIQCIDACNPQVDYGKLNLELIWYDLSDETGKYMLDVQEELGSFEQEKQYFLGEGATEDFAGGSLRLTSRSEACVNEITGPTGKTGYHTDALYYCFTGTTFIKLSISTAIKPETIRSIIKKIAEETMKFDFSVYKSINSQQD